MPSNPMLPVSPEPAVPDPTSNAPPPEYRSTLFACPIPVAVSLFSIYFQPRNANGSILQEAAGTATNANSSTPFEANSPPTRLPLRPPGPNSKGHQPLTAEVRARAGSPPWKPSNDICTSAVRLLPNSWIPGSPRAAEHPQSHQRPSLLLLVPARV